MIWLKVICLCFLALCFAMPIMYPDAVVQPGEKV